MPIDNLPVRQKVGAPTPEVPVQGVDGVINRPMFISDLLPSERGLVAAMNQLGFGRFESVRIERGELVLDPWPTTVRGVKFASVDTTPDVLSDEMQLKRQVIELFEYVRSVDAGEIRCLEVRHGLPFTMEVEHRPIPSGGRHG